MLDCEVVTSTLEFCLFEDLLLSSLLALAEEFELPKLDELLSVSALLFESPPTVILADVQVPTCINSTFWSTHSYTLKSI